jgi:hypothetical protein
MDKEKRIYNSEVMALPSLRLVLGDIPAPDPDRQNRSKQQTLKSGQEIKGTVKRIIARLEED